ncbi:MAG TPA: AMP-binding protein, partial [Candidatus Polarisedimenticolia bacterium]|nr:AMP-binding protein [Candidatus Polarisedimenticolia bacterium]
MEIRTLCDILTGLDRQHRKPALLRYKAGGAWLDISTEEFVGRVRSCAAGLAALGVGRGDRMAILSENRPEWTIFDHAVVNLGAVNVPIYPTLLTDQVRFILENSQSKVLVVSNGAQIDKVVPALGS